MAEDYREFVERQRILGQAQLSDFDPTDADHQVHLARYAFASRIIRPPCVVLDIACGIGYGARHLADSAAGVEVVGVDISDQAVRFGAPRFRNDSVRFMVGDGTRLPFLGGTFDFVTSFETIEHIPTHEDYLAELRRVLKPGGRLILSTPNREFSDPLGSLESRPQSPHHIREWRAGELQDVLGRFFDRIEFFSQLPVNRPQLEKIFIVSRRPLARLVPALRTAWVWWHRRRARGAGRTSEDVRALQEKFRVSPWNERQPGRILLATAESTGKQAPAPKSV